MALQTRKDLRWSAFFMTEQTERNNTDSMSGWLPTAAGIAGAALLPLARGGWDLWAKAYACAALALLLALWACLQILRGSISLPKAKTAAIPLACMALCWLSLTYSDINWLCRPEFAAFLIGASPFLFFPLADKKETVFQAIFGAALFLALLALYQKFFLHTAATASFFNENVFAGFAVTVLPLLAGRKRYVETAILGAALLCTGSRGAMLALALAGGICLLPHAGKSRWTGLAALAGGLLAAISLNWHSLSDRAGWWAEAAKMAIQKPLLGFGPGSFEFVYPSLHSPRPDGLSTIYAHNYPLECAASCGLLFALLWTVWLFYRAWETGGFIRWAALAALLLSLEDYTLNVPSNLFLLCLFLSSEDETTSLRINNRTLRVLSAVCLLSGGMALAGLSLSMLQADKETLNAKTLYESGEKTAGLAAAKAVLSKYPSSYQAAQVHASILMSSAGGNASPALAEAYERLLSLNPYRPQTYDSLEKIYMALGQPALTRDIIERRNLAIKWR